MSILLRAVQTAVHPESEQEGGSDVGLLTKIIHNKASQINEKSLNDINYIFLIERITLLIEITGHCQRGSED